eukprot:9883575-Alexandrium_andersonii.AAC.1
MSESAPLGVPLRGAPRCCDCARSEADLGDLSEPLWRGSTLAHGAGRWRGWCTRVALRGLDHGLIQLGICGGLWAGLN